jgi:hypothetical protein
LHSFDFNFLIHAGPPEFRNENPPSSLSHSYQESTSDFINNREILLAPIETPSGVYPDRSVQALTTIASNLPWANPD